MNESQNAPAGGPSWVPLGPRERRVLGVMVEKAKTTPENYPMTIAAIVTACNQKTNRDPITNYDQDDVEDTLHSLRKKGATILVEGSGRVPRWKYTLYEWLKVSKVELAVLAELLLRGPQTEGDLRARASRMEPLADLPTLQAILEALAARTGPVPLAVWTEARGVRRSWTLPSRGTGAGPPCIRRPGRRRGRGALATLDGAGRARGGDRRADLGDRDRRPPCRGEPAPWCAGCPDRRSPRTEVRARSLIA